MPQPSKRLLLGVAMTLVTAAMGLSTRSQEAGPTVPLPPPPFAPVKAEPARIPKQGIERSLAGGGVHSYQIELPANAFLHVTAEQDRIDVALRLSDPEGTEVLEVDSPTGGQGPENLYFVAEKAGEYRLEVRASDTKASEGQYALRIASLRPAEDSDRRRAEAEMEFHRARTRRQSDPEAARVGFREAARLFAALGDRKRQGDSLFQLAKLTTDPVGSLGLVEQAWTLSREAGDRYGELASSNELVRRLEGAGADLDRAAELGRRAVELAQALGDPRSEAVARANLGQILLSRGDAWEALAQLEAAVGLWQSLEDPGEEASTEIPTANAYAALGKPRTGVKYLDRALSILPVDDRQRRAAALTKKGDLLSQLGEPEAARTALRQALHLRSPDDLNGQANTRLSLGALAYRQGRFREAVEEYEKAAPVFETGRDPRKRLALRINQGWAHAGLRDFDRATALLRSALEEARRHGIRPAEASALFGLAWIGRRQGREEEALRQAEAALNLIESMRNAERRDLRASYLAANLDPYDFLIDFWMERHRREPRARYDLQALAVSERSRGRSLLDELDTGSAQPLPLETIQRVALADGSLLLEYHLGEIRSFLWAIDAVGVATYELPPREEIEKLTDRVLADMVASRGGDGDERDLDEKGRELSRILLGPVAGRLQSLGEHPLRIAADGNLHALSFAALPDPTVPASRPYEPLLVRRLIIHTLSGSVLAAQSLSHRWRSEPYGRLALIGDPVFTPVDERLLALPAWTDRPPGLIDRSSLGYRRLPNTQLEIERIQALAPRGSVLVRTGFDANRDFIMQGGLRGFDILHIASHARVDPGDGGRAALVLSLYNRDGHRIEGFLRARDIDALRLSARLIVLSACQTGLGEDLRGEGQVGLAQSFLAAGADDVVASLWNVPDDRTYELMSGFYDRLLREGLSPPQALRQAQLAAWHDPEYRSPYYWAGFTIQGRGAPATPGMKRGAPPPEPGR